jgi:hypothetical protein
MTPRYLAIPQELRARPNWVCWKLEQRDGKPTKVPYSPRSGRKADATDPSSWSSFDDAVAALSRGGYSGVGFCLSPPYVGIDLDGCRSEAGNEPWADEIIRELDSYSEVSPSRDGVHVIMKGEVPEGRCQHEFKDRPHHGIALYRPFTRYLTMTGESLNGSIVQERTAELARIHARLFLPQRKPQPRPTQPSSASDRELLDRALSAKNGAKFASLWNGYCEGYSSQSEADLALCMELAFWTSRDAGRMDELFHQSGLMRPKWERPDYRLRTIGKAIEMTTEVWTPPSKPQRPVMAPPAEPIKADPPETAAPKKTATMAAPTPEPKPEQPPEWPEEPPGPASDAGTLLIRCVADIEAKPVHWLWPHRIPRGKLSILAGSPGRGKSQITASMAAIITRGTQWPVDRQSASVGSVVFLTAEDDVADTLRPRLEAAGADLKRIHVVDGVIRGYDGNGTRTERMFSLEQDLQALGAKLTELEDVVMVVIDPISAYLGKVDSHKNAEVRVLLAPLADLAAKHNVGVAAVTHLNKAAAPNALLRVMGSLAFVAAARTAWLVADDPQNKTRRLFLPLKNNLGPDQDGLAFHIQGATVPSAEGPIETSCVTWNSETVSISADDAMRATETAPPRKSPALEEAKTWLVKMLSTGPLPSSTIFEEARGAGIATKTLYRGKAELEIKAEKDGKTWIWTL